jgi:hypothetical protein
MARKRRHESILRLDGAARIHERPDNEHAIGATMKHLPAILFIAAAVAVLEDALVALLGNPAAGQVTGQVAGQVEKK